MHIKSTPSFKNILLKILTVLVVLFHRQWIFFLDCHEYDYEIDIYSPYKFPLHTETLLLESSMPTVNKTQYYLILF